MAPPNKRKAEEDFILTLSDNEDDLAEIEEELPASPKPSSKKRKLEAASAAAGSSSKKAKKAKKSKNKANASNDDEEDVEGDEDQGVWGAKDEDDGAMDSDFEFQLEDGGDGTGAMEEFEGWGFGKCFAAV